jgi:hypothetical protein
LTFFFIKARGRDRGGYYNELFLRNRVYLAHAIQRMKVKGTGVRARSNPDQEPDFWSMPFVEQSHAVPSRTSMSMPQHLQDLQSSVTSLFNQTQKLTMDLSSFNYSSPPPQVVSSNNSANDDLCLGFGDKQFHFLDPVAPRTQAPPTVQQLPSQPSWSNDEVNDLVDDMLGADMDSFFDDFEFPEETVLQETNLEDDNIFGELLEQMIA